MSESVSSQAEQAEVNPFLVDIKDRTGRGSSAMRRYRRDGMLPINVYERGTEPVAALVSYRDFVRSAERARISQVFTLKSTDGKLNGRAAIVKEVQKEHLSGRLLHVDFQTLKDNEEITIRIPLEFTGEATGVKNDGGILSVATYELAVRCLPKFIPVSVKVDVSPLKIGQSIHAKELGLPGNVKLGGNPEETVVSVVIVRQVVEEVATAAVADAAAGTPAADGAAAAAPDAAAAGGDKKAAAGGDKKAAGGDKAPAKK